MKRLILVVVTTATAACTSMQPVPPSYLETNNPQSIRLYSGGEVTVLDEPKLNGNTLSGFDRLERAETRWEVSRISRMEVRAFDKKKTTLFAGGVSLLAAAGIYMMTKQEGGKGLICDNYQVDARCVPAPAQIPVGLKLRF